MLVKFGKIGQEVREYCMQDGSSIRDLLEVINHDMDYDDVIHISNNPNQTIDESNASAFDLEEGVTYILESVTLTLSEEDMCELLENNELSLEDHSTIERKKLISKIVQMVNHHSWDK